MLTHDESQGDYKATSTDGHSVSLFGIRIDAVSRRSAVARVVRTAKNGCGGTLMTVNLDILRQIRANPELDRFAQRADCRVADGMPLLWAASIAGNRLPQRVCGSDVIWDIAREASDHGLGLFLLGGNPGVADSAADILRRRNPGLNAATHCPPFGFEKRPEEWSRMYNALRSADPHIVLVGLGCPRQERVIARLAPMFPNVYWIGVGYAFGFVAGEQPRAPSFMQRSGLEWLHRLWSEPSRMWRRYLLTGIPFAVRLLAHATHLRLLGRARS